MKKVCNEVLIESYSRLKSVWKVGKEVGLCGQSVQERLKRLNLTKSCAYKPEEIQSVKDLYSSGFQRGDGKTDKLCVSSGMPKWKISTIAKKLGLSSRNRQICDKSCDLMSDRMKSYIQKKGHPRGMLGKTHSDEYKQECKRRQTEWSEKASDKEKMDRVKKSFITKLKRYGSISPINPKVTWKQGWRTFGGREIYFRSRWEANYGRYLQWLKENGYIKDWLHEPKTFWFEGIKRGAITYLPDYQVFNLDGSHQWVEVKGWYDARSKTKIKRFRKQFPDEKLVLIDSKWFKSNNQKMCLIIPEWEKDRGAMPSDFKGPLRREPWFSESVN